MPVEVKTPEEVGVGDKAAGDHRSHDSERSEWP